MSSFSVPVLSEKDLTVLNVAAGAESNVVLPGYHLPPGDRLDMERVNALFRYSIHEKQFNRLEILLFTPAPSKVYLHSTGRLRVVGYKDDKSALLHMAMVCQRLKDQGFETAKLTDFQVSNVLTEYRGLMGTEINLLGLSGDGRLVTEFSPMGVQIHDGSRQVFISVGPSGVITVKGKASVAKQCESLNQYLPVILEHKVLAV